MASARVYIIRCLRLIVCTCSTCILYLEPRVCLPAGKGDGWGEEDEEEGVEEKGKIQRNKSRKENEKGRRKETERSSERKTRSAK